MAHIYSYTIQMHCMRTVQAHAVQDTVIHVRYIKERILTHTHKPDR